MWVFGTKSKNLSTFKAIKSPMEILSRRKWSNCFESKLWTITTISAAAGTKPTNDAYTAATSIPAASATNLTHSKLPQQQQQQ